MAKISSEVGSMNNYEMEPRNKRKKKKDLDELTSVGGAHDNTIKLDNLPIEKEAALEGEIEILPNNPPPSVGSNSGIGEPKISPPVDVTANYFTYYHLLKDSLAYPEYLYILSFVLEFECCHLAITALISISYGIAFIIALVILAPVFYNIITFMSRCCKTCASRRGTPIFIMIMLAVVLTIIAIVEFVMFPTNEQFAHWALTLPVFVLQAGLKDLLIFLYCRNRNEEKHTLAALLRKYVRWQRLINHVEEIHSEQ